MNRDSGIDRYMAAVLAVLFSLLLASCDGGGGGTSSTSPTISGFTADVSTISAGASVNLTAVFADGTGTIDNGVGGVTSSTSVSVTPSSTTTYTLTVTNAAGASATSTITITVNTSGLPTVTSFTAGTTTIPAGSSVNLSAVFAGGTGSIDNGIGSVTSGTPVSVSPITTTTYTLTVTNTSGSVTSTVTVNVLGLDVLSVSGANLDQFFQPNQLAYTATVGFVTSSVTVTATTGNAGATITVNGIAIGASNTSQSIALVEGINPAISIVVTAADSTTMTYTLTITRQFAATFAQQAYIKASNTGRDDFFGYSVSLSGDTLAVGAYGESGTGAVYVFIRSGSTWAQQAYIKPSNIGVANQNNSFGYSVALSGDILAVGRYAERSAATGVNGDEADTSAFDSGAVYIFSRSGTNWSQQAYIKASNTGQNDRFGISVALSGDTLVVGAIGEASSATGINGNELDNSATSAGAAYVFVLSGGVWSQQAYIKASNMGYGDVFGRSVSISGDTIAVAAIGEGSAATGVNGDQINNTPPGGHGAVYVFTRNGTAWSQQAYIKASNTDANDWFGISISLSEDTLAVGANIESSAATGVNGDQTDNSALVSGAAYIFVRDATIWSQQAYIKASNTGARDQFGFSVSLSGDTLLIGAPGEGSISSGVNADQTNNDARGKGATYMFTRTGTDWTQKAYIKASNAIYANGFGSSVSVFENTLAIGASGEPSSSTGINGNETNEGAPNSGAVYVFQ